MSPARVRSLALAVALAAALGWSAAASAQDRPEAGELRFGRWSAGFLGREAAGAFCWLGHPDGRWRCELAAPDQDDRDPRELLLDRAGEGWSLVDAGAGAATFQSWRRPFRELDPGAACALAAVLAALGSGDAPQEGSCVEIPASPAGLPSGRPAFFGPGGARGTGDASFRIVLPLMAVDPDGPAPDPRGRMRPGLRARLETRALGRGDAVETWSAAWTRDDAGDPALGLVSSRRPGRVVLALRDSLPVRYFPDEVFLPLWPLAEVLEIP